MLPAGNEKCGCCCAGFQDFSVIGRIIDLNQFIESLIFLLLCSLWVLLDTVIYYQCHGPCVSLCWHMFLSLSSGSTHTPVIVYSPAAH